MYYEEEGSGGGTFMAGLVLGTVLGAGLALMLTPQSGRRTRRQIRKAIDRAGLDTDRLSHMSDELREALRAGGRRMRS